MNPPSNRSCPDAAGTARIRRALWLPALAFVLYGLLLAHYCGAYAAGSDSSGYMNNARLLDRGSLIALMRRIPGVDPNTVSSFTYVPLGFNPREDRAQMVPSYPIGLPLLIMLAAHLVGWDLAPALTMVLHALFALWLVYRLGRESGLEPGWAWLGAMLLAASPVFILVSLQVMSDVPAMAWVTAAVLCAWKSRERPWMALLSGAAAAIAVMDRPTDLLVFVPVGIALGLGFRRWFLLALGGLPGAVLLGAVNHAAYGRVFATGYGGMGWLFSAANVPVTLLHYAHWLPALFTPLVLLCLGLPALRRQPPLGPGLLAAWGLVFAGFYLFYECTHEIWWSLRFILPAIPPILVAALLVARALVSAAGTRVLAFRGRWLALAAAALLVFGWHWFRHFGLGRVAAGERAYVEAASWMKSNLPPGAVVASMQMSGTLFYYTPFTIVRWDSLSPAEFERIAAACAAAGRPVYAALYRFEIEEQGAFRKHLTGRWTRIATAGETSIWRRISPPEQALPSAGTGQ